MYACLGQASSGTVCGSPAGSSGLVPAFLNPCLRAPAVFPRRACVTNPTGSPSFGGPLASRHASPRVHTRAVSHATVRRAWLGVLAATRYLASRDAAARCCGHLNSLQSTGRFLSCQSSRALAHSQSCKAWSTGCLGHFPKAPCFVAMIKLGPLRYQATGLTHRSTGPAPASRVRPVNSNVRRLRMTNVRVLWSGFEWHRMRFASRQFRFGAGTSECLSPGATGFPATSLRHQSHGRPVLRRSARQPSCVTARAHSGGLARNGAQGVAWRAGCAGRSRFARCSGAVQRSPQLASVNRNVSLLPVQPGPRTPAVLQGVEFRLPRALPQRAVLRSKGQARSLAFSDNRPNPSFNRTCPGKPGQAG